MTAPAGLLPLPRPLMTSEVLDAAFRVFRAGILRCLPYSALMVLLLQVPSMYHLFLDPALLSTLAAAAELNPRTVAHLIAMVLAVPLIGALTLRLDSVARGERPRFRRELATVLLRWPPALIATAGAFFIPVAMYFIGPTINQALGSAAYLFLAVPLLWPSALFVVALPAFWCDRFGPFQAVVTSAAISARRSWRMFGAILAAMTVVGVFFFFAAAVLGVLAPLLMQADLFLFAAVQVLVFVVVGAFGVPFVIAVLIVAHRDLELRYRERQGGAP